MWLVSAPSTLAPAYAVMQVPIPERVGHVGWEEQDRSFTVATAPDDLFSEWRFVAFP